MQDKVQREDVGHLKPFEVACDDTVEVGAHTLLGDFAQQDIIALPSHTQQFASNQQLANLIGTRANFSQTRITPQAFHVEVG